MGNIVLPNYSDDSKSKAYIMNELMPRVFHDIPLNSLNIGMYSIIAEYLSQGLENQSFTSSFFFNESFITKAVLPDSVYAEAAIFNIGYAFATPSSTMFLLELKLEDIYANAVRNATTGLYEFIIDKDTKFNLSNGNVYSLDYDILLQYKNEETSSRKAAIPAWNVQYTNLDEKNSIAINKDIYITYRVTDTWLCLYVHTSEFERESHIVVNNIAGGLPNDDTVITCMNHICGFDIKYIDGDGNEQWLDHKHILPVNVDAPDMDTPYVHYVMDNQQTIRFMWQLMGSRYFVPPTNTSYEIIIYTCHGEAANFSAYDNTEQPSVISTSSKYSNNGNVQKTGWLAAPSVGGTNIGNMETVRRETIEAYNTANVISSDHDLDEWFKTFFFKNVMYPFFFKRRDDPWGRIWSGFLALKDKDDYIFRTNTLQARIPYEVLYNNNDNTVTSNEIIIPPGWVWVYDGGINSNDEGRYTVAPYLHDGSKLVETADTQASIEAPFAFANPFGIRIQKDPFAIGYFNQWINQNVTATRITSLETNTVGANIDDLSITYHATPIMINFKRTYKDNYYNITSFVDPTIDGWIDGSPMVKYLRNNATPPTFSSAMWIYFREPLDLFTSEIPIVPLKREDGYISFDPKKTYFCVKTREKMDNGEWLLSGISIRDNTDITGKVVQLPITGGDIIGYFGTDEIWGDGSTYWEPVYASQDTTIQLYPNRTVEEVEEIKYVKFARITSQNYYEMRLSDDANVGTIQKITVQYSVRTDLTKYDETNLWRIGNPYSNVVVNVYFNGQDNPVVYTITNPANVYVPYSFVRNGEVWECTEFGNVGGKGIILYAEMKPTPESGSVNYYRIQFSKLAKNKPMFSIKNTLLPVDQNNMRVLLHAMINGVETGMIEMQPIYHDSDGTYRFEARMYPLNDMVDVDNRIDIASITNGGGSWIASGGGVVNVDAVHPELKMSILVRSEDSTLDSPVSIGDTYTGFRVVDEYVIDDVSLVEELKEMRSVVVWGDSSIPTEDQIKLYTNMMDLNTYHEGVDNIITITKYAYDKTHENELSQTYNEIQSIALTMKNMFNDYCYGTEDTLGYTNIVSETLPNAFIHILDILNAIVTNIDEKKINWNDTYVTLFNYDSTINDGFDAINIHDGLKIQLVPFVEYELMMNERFESFVASFTNVHKVLEPVIMRRLEGNNYLDCKLIATYGLPHSYVADTDKDDTNAIKYWPDLNVQLEFDVCLYNQALTTNTINELRNIVKEYFNRITGVHTPVESISMDNNIYISHLIQQMEQHDNVAWMRFKGWYTNEKNQPNGDYKDANTQGIIRLREVLEDMRTEELQHYVPEMFVLDDDNIVINIV